MNKFEDILNHYKDSIKWYDHDKYKPHKVEYGDYYFTIWSDEYDIRWTISLNDLLSPESWLLQACKWKVRFWSIAHISHDEDDKIYVDDFEHWYREREYHAMMLSIISQEEKVKYLEDNVIVE